MQIFLQPIFTRKRMNISIIKNNLIISLVGIYNYEHSYEKF
jgi:hypothetical protein